MNTRPSFDNPERTTLVKALHTATTIPRLAVYLIESDKFSVKHPEAAVRKALEIVGQRFDKNGKEWRDDDVQLVKCIDATKKLLAKLAK